MIMRDDSVSEFSSASEYMREMTPLVLSAVIAKSHSPLRRKAPP